jgi:hypothetical protein
LFGLGPTASQPLQLLPVFRTTSNCGRISCHAPKYTIYRVSLQVSTSRGSSSEAGRKMLSWPDPANQKTSEAPFRIPGCSGRCCWSGAEQSHVQ